MPINQKLMSNLVREYGAKKGKSIYYAMEQEGKVYLSKGKKAPKPRHKKKARKKK